jgi:hypothetical protein
MLIRLSAPVTSQGMDMVWWANACLVAMVAYALIVTCTSRAVLSEMVLRRSTVRQCLSYTMYDIGLVIHNILMIYAHAMKSMFIGDNVGSRWGSSWEIYVGALARCIMRHLRWE